MSNDQRKSIIKAALLASVSGATAEQVAEAAGLTDGTLGVKSGVRAGGIVDGGPTWVKFIKHKAV